MEATAYCTYPSYSLAALIRTLELFGQNHGAHCSENGKGIFQFSIDISSASDDLEEDDDD